MTKQILQSLLSGKKAIVADEDNRFSVYLADMLKEAGMNAIVTDKGDHAWNLIQNKGFDLAIINVCLSGMLGIEIVDRIKNLPTVNGIKVVLVGAIHRAYRYHSAPLTLYGADAYIENLISEGEFYRLLAQLFTLETEDVSEGDESSSDPTEIKEAKSLARIILSDIISYNVKKAERGIRRGNFYELFEEELEKGKDYYNSRVPEHIRKENDYFYSTVNDYLRSKRHELLERQEI